jgi:hypothetical protein
VLIISWKARYYVMGSRMESCRSHGGSPVHGFERGKQKNVYTFMRIKISLLGREPLEEHVKAQVRACESMLARSVVLSGERPL